MKIHIEIDHLALYGFSHHENRRITSAITNELIALIKEKGFPQGVSEKKEISSLNTHSQGLRTNSQPKTIGTHVANSIYGALGQKTSPGNNIVSYSMGS